MKLLFILLLATTMNAQVIKDTVDQCYSVILVDVSEDSLLQYADYYQVDAAMDDDSRNILSTHEMQYYHLYATQGRKVWIWILIDTVWQGDLAIAIMVNDTTCLGELKYWPEAVRNLKIIK